VLLCLCVLVALPGCGDGSEAPSTDDSDANKQAAAGDYPSSTTGVDPADIPIPEVTTGICRVYTPQPGFYVLVDGEIARDAGSGEWLTTPCAVTVPIGSHDIKVAKPGFRDTPYPDRVSVSHENVVEVVVEPVKDPQGDVVSVLDAPYRKAKVGEPVALESLNSVGMETDPFLTADGLAIYFVADRPEGNGIYYATRSSPYVAFDSPQLLRSSRGFDAKATPSITADSHAVVYALTEKQRVVALLRPNPLGDFVEKENLKYSTRTGEHWRSAQMLSDGLRFYWTVEKKGKLETHVTSRRSAEDRFGKILRVDMPGTHPCLSADGLRQYVYDGKTLRRARRRRVTSKFSRLEVIHELLLENYVHHAQRRQYFVSDDEQWLLYSDNPDDGGDLYMVRLSEGKSWGFVVTGNSVPPRAVVASIPAKEQPKLDPAPGASAPDVDPRSVPLPYTRHWKQFRTLMAAKKYVAAKQQVERSLADPKFQRDRDLLQWDQDDADRAIGFWNDVRQSLGSMKPGEKIRFGTAKVALISFDRKKDEITAHTKTKEIKKKIQGMSPVNLLSLVDRIVEKTDEPAQARAGVYLYYDPVGGNNSAATRLGRAGKVGHEFYERLAVRMTRQARQEFERNNIAAGLRFIDKVTSEFPHTKTAEEAKQLERQAYRFTKWERRGRWQDGNPGEFIAGTGRVANSYLVSPQQYENFELRLEWKTTVAGAGGVFFRYRGRGDPYLFGYKIQLSDDFGSERVDQQTTGALLNETPPTTNAVGKRGEWNTLNIQVRGTHVVVTINGRKVLDRRADVTDRKPLRGYVMLDGVNGGITYRKTLLIQLPASE
jgi:hypothetical protein